MTLAMLGTALLPTHAQAGAVAGWLLFLLRCAMGFSVGGEYNVVVAYLLDFDSLLSLCVSQQPRALPTCESSVVRSHGFACEAWITRKRRAVDCRP